MNKYRGPARADFHANRGPRKSNLLYQRDAERVAQLGKVLFTVKERFTVKPLPFRVRIAFQTGFVGTALHVKDAGLVLIHTAVGVFHNHFP